MLLSLHFFIDLHSDVYSADNITRPRRNTIIANSKPT